MSFATREKLLEGIRHIMIEVKNIYQWLYAANSRSIQYKGAFISKLLLVIFFNISQILRQCGVFYFCYYYYD